ncbi:STAS domain-containing protein [Nocardioides sp.]|uniref:STAS domain-containing protein n=1 Tax=Nocardioides sp. TaxID=35761 RepID=UPI0037839C54
MDFSTTLTMEPPTATLTASGELDIFTAHQVARQLVDALGSGCRRLLVDVRDVTFVDASALGVLDRARHAVALQSGSMDVVAAGPRFRRLCVLAGLAGAFELS